MSSFTDNPQQLGSFNPYVHTLPVEEMAHVGMIKQSQFDQGVQKVQGYVDALSALPIAKSEVQGYVQQKLGQLKENTTKNLQGDFSDNRVINQIGGAARQISRDPIVQNGVLSTAKMQSAIAEMNDAKKGTTGEKASRYAPENEYALNSSVSSWLNDGKIDSQFTGGYTPYTDVVGETIKLYKEMHPGEDINEDAFRTNSKGEVEINPTMIEGVSPKRIQDTLNLVMQRGDVQQQLQITGQYRFRGMDQNAIGKALQTSTNSTLSTIQKTIQGLQMKLATDASSSSVALSQQIEQLKQQAQQLKDGFKGNIETLKSNPDALKAQLVKNDISQNFIGAYAYQTLKKSPLWETQMDVAKYELDKAQFGLDQNKFTYEQQHDKDLLNLEQQKLLMSVQKEAKKAGGTGEDVVTTQGNIAEDAGKLGSQTFDQLYNDKITDLNQGMYGLVFSLMNNSDATGLNPIKTLPGGGYAFNVDPTGKTGFPTLKEAHDEYTRIYADGRTKIMAGGAKPALIQEYQKLDPLIRSARNLGEQKQILDEKKAIFLEQVKKETGVANLDYAEAYTVNNQLPGWEQSQARLRQKYGPDWKGKLGIAPKSQGFTMGAGGEFYPVTSSEGPNYKEYSNFASKFDKALVPKLQALEEDYKSRQMVFNPLVSTQLAATPEDKEIMRERFRNITSGITSGEGGIQYSNKEMRVALEADSKDKFKDNIYGGYQDPLTHKFYLTVQQGGTKSTPIKMEVTQKEFEAIPGFKTSNQFWQKYGDDLSLTNNTTTDVPLNGKPGGINTAYVMDRAPSSKYDVRYHVTGDGKGAYNLNLYVLDKKGNIILNRVNAGLSTNMDGVLSAIDQLKSDQLIEALITQNK